MFNYVLIVQHAVHDYWGIFGCNEEGTVIIGVAYSEEAAYYWAASEWHETEIISVEEYLEIFFPIEEI